METETVDPAAAAISRQTEIKTLSVSRRHVLGQLYGRCEHLESIPVYIEGDEVNVIGQSMRVSGSTQTPLYFILKTNFASAWPLGSIHIHSITLKVTAIRWPQICRGILSSLTA